MLMKKLYLLVVLIGLIGGIWWLGTRMLQTGYIQIYKEKCIGGVIATCSFPGSKWDVYVGGMLWYQKQCDIKCM